MKITNNLNLPQPIYDAICYKPYTKGASDYSITQLLKPPRATSLEKQHYAELEQDVSDMIWLLIGICAHEILDRAEKEALPRDRMFMTLAGKIVSGANDRFVVRSGVLQDYKVTSAWKVKKGMDADWEAQLNGYIYLLHLAGYTVQKAQIVAILRDWSKPKAEEAFFTGINYPLHQIQILDSPIWPLEKTKAFFEEKVRLHEAALLELPLCTAAERWADEDTYALYKNGKKERAAKVYGSLSEAEAHVKAFTDDKSKFEIVKRPGVAKRCEFYCLARNFCEQYKTTKCNTTASPS